MSERRMAEQAGDPAAVSRREVLRSVALSLLAAGAGVPLTAEAAQHVHQAASEEKQKMGGAYRPKLLNEHEFATLRRLAELIVPADDRSGSAADAGAAEFIDLLCSQNSVLANTYTGGLAWLDARMRTRHNSTFLAASGQQQTELLDIFVTITQMQRGWRESHQSYDATDHFKTLSGYGVHRPTDYGPGVHFFDWLLRMTVDAFYTSPIGAKDLDFRGNGVYSKYEVPKEALEYALRRSPFA
jgi:gluconate 2-dehydrogenase gamma chain